MTVRVSAVTAAIGLVVSVSAYAADPPGGDIVDQVLRSTTRPAVGPTAPVAAQSAPPAAQPTPLVAPPAAAPSPMPPALQPASTIAGPDIIGDTSVTPVPPAPPTLASRWQGFYVGANVGGGWTAGAIASTCTNALTGSSAGCPVLNDSGLSGSGALGGAQIGYLTPVTLRSGMPPLVVGAEADVEGSGIAGSQRIGGAIPLVGFPRCTDCSFSANQSIDWFGTMRLRLGVPIDNVLLYATGGLIYGGLHAAQSIASASAGSYSADVRTAHVGPTVGAGAELLVSGPWSARIEALYYDLGKASTVAQPTNGALGIFSNAKTFEFRGGIIRLGIDLRLGDLVF